MVKASSDLLCTRHVCIQKHTCVCPQAAIGRPTFDPWVQPSMDCFWNTHVCVLTAAIGLLKLLDVQNLHLARWLNSSAKQMFVCSQQQLVGSPSVDLFCNTCVSVLTATVGKLQLTCSAPDMCVFSNTHVYAHSSSWSAKPWSLDATLNWLILQHTCVVSFSNTCVYVLTAAIALPTVFLNWQSFNCWMFRTFTWLLHWAIPQHTHVCNHSSTRPANPQFTSCATYVCICSQQQSSRSAKFF